MVQNVWRAQRILFLTLQPPSEPALPAPQIITPSIIDAFLATKIFRNALPATTQALNLTVPAVRKPLL